MNPNEWEELVDHCGDEFQTYSAFTVAELGEMLPPYFATHKRDNEGDWLCFDNNLDINEITDEYFYGKNEVEARAKMLIHLLTTNEEFNVKLLHSYENK